MITSRGKLLKNVVIYTVLPRVSVLVSLFVTPILSEFLTLKDFGIYSLLMAYVSVLQIVIIIGQNVILQNAFFEYGRHFALIWRRSFGLMMLAGVLGALILDVLIHFTMENELGRMEIPVCLMLDFFLILSPIEVIATNYFVLKERPLPFAICAFLIGLITVFLNIYTIKYLRLGYVGWIIVMPSSVIVMYLFYFKEFFIRNNFGPSFLIKMRFLRKALQVGLPLTPHQLSLYILGSADRLLLSFYKVPVLQLGFYSQGYNIGGYGSIFVNGVFQGIARKLQEGFRGSEAKHLRFVRSCIILVPIGISIILLVVSLWMKEVFGLLYRKPELQLAYPVSIIVMCSYMFWPLYTFFSIPLGIEKKTYSISRITMTASAVNLILNMIFIRFWGIWASLGATYVSYMVFGVAGLLDKNAVTILNKYVRMARLVLGLVILNVIFFSLAFLLKDASLVSKAIASFVILIGAAFFLRYSKKIIDASSYLCRI